MLPVLLLFVFFKIIECVSSSGKEYWQEVIYLMLVVPGTS